MFFDSWSGLLRVVVVGTTAYVALTVLLRASGERTLATLDAFDVVVTVALSEGVTALSLLVVLQRVVAWASVRSPAVRRLVPSEPALVHRGGYLPQTVRRERVTREELRQTARAQGHADLSRVRTTVRETDGTLSILDSPPDPLTGTTGGH